MLLKLEVGREKIISPNKYMCVNYWDKNFDILKPPYSFLLLIGE